MLWNVLRRRRGLVLLVALVCIAVPSTLRHGVTSPVWLTGVALLLLWLALGRWPAEPLAQRRSVLVAPPVTGRWSGLNGPADKVPSHGTHGLGQTYAIDVCHVPEGLAEERQRRFHWLWPQTRRPEFYASFGQPLFAPADGVVVRASGRQRDHLGRMSTLGLLYLLVLEAPVRALGGYRFMFGNHVIVRIEKPLRQGGDGDEDGVGHGDGLGEGTGERTGEETGEVYAVLAHLRRGSLSVRAGDRVVAGQLLGECGNSGNSSDPHLHFHLMDSADPAKANGVPFRWRYRDEDGGEHVGVPRDGELFHVRPPQATGTRTATSPGASSEAPSERD